MGAVAVAKRKRPADTAPASEVPSPSPRSASTMIRSSEEWKATLEELVEFDRVGSTADLIDRAVVAYARMVGFTKPFPRR